MIWASLALLLGALWAAGRWTCWFGCHWKHTGYTDEPWLHYYECHLCHAKHEYSPWDEAGYR